MPVTSSEGERHAVRGFRDQYLYSARLIHDMLFDKVKLLEWIKLLDPNALTIDDFQYALQREVHAFQIKWKEYPTAIGWASLLGKTRKQSMIERLASAWLSLRQIHPKRRVVVHLVHNSPASKDGGSAHGVSLHEFLDRGWIGTQLDGYENVQAYDEIWQSLKTASGLSDEQFAEFVPDCKLHFGVTKPIENDDVRKITSWLFEKVSKGGRGLQFTPRQLLDELGWASDYEAPHQDFKVPPHYEEIHATATDLRLRLNNTSRGYIAVLGSPGSGKSTLLTNVLTTTKDIRLIRYYAFAPDEHYGARGEATDFLHSITLQLQRSGVFVGRQRRPAKSERLKLLELLEDQFQQCHTDYRTTGLKTIVLVDGLDHIERELHPDRSLLKDFLNPDSLPEGVVFVLGSQKLVLKGLPNPIRVHLESGHVVPMAPMSVDAMELTIDNALPESKPHDRKRIQEIADGHPLALNYLLELLRHRPIDEWAAVLRNSDRFTGDIDKLYRKHWHDIDPKADLCHALGLMARFRGPIPMRMVQGWMEPNVRGFVGKNLRHYFKENRDNTWSFFHNSFRLFLQAETRVPMLAETPDEREREFHHELASKLREAAEPWCWDALAHDYRAEEYVHIRSTVSLDYFKEQVMAFRHPSAVLEDLELVMKTAVALKDPLLLVRAILISADIEQRHDALDDEAIIGTLVRLGNVDKAMAYLLDGNRLRVTMKVALQACISLVEQGFRADGERLFEIAQPIECVTFRPIGRTLGNHEMSNEVLKVWALSAPYFLNADQLLGCVEQLRLEQEEYTQRTPEQVASENKTRLLYSISASYAALQKWESWMLAHSRLKELSATYALLALTSAIEGCAGNDAHKAERLFELLRNTGIPHLSDDNRLERTALFLRVVNIALDRKDHEMAVEWIQNVERVPLCDTGMRLNDGELVRWSFRKARVDVRLNGSIPDDSIERDESETEWPRTFDEDTRERTRLVRRAVYDMVAYARTDPQFRRSVKPGGILRWVVDLMVDEAGSGIQHKLYLERVRPELIHCLVQVLRSEKEIREFVDYCRTSWPARYQRVLARELTGFGYDDLVEELADAALLTDAQGGQPFNRVADLKEQIDLRLLIGNYDRAKALLRELVAAARGPISEKDYQWSTWADWLVRVNELEPSSALVRNRIMLERLLAMQSDSTDAGNAIDTMLIDLYRIHPGAAVNLTRVLQERGDVNHASALSAVLLAATRDDGVSSTIILRILEDLLIPLSWVGDIDLLPELLVRLKRHEGPERVQSIVSEWIRMIRARANHKDRYSWFFHLSGALQVIGSSPLDAGITPEELIDPTRYDEERPPMLHLAGGLVVPVAEAAEGVNSILDFQTLRAKQDPEKPYSSDWVALVGLALKGADLSELELWADVVEGEFDGRKGVNALTDIADRLIASGSKAAALKISSRAVALCDAGGWIQIFDGGSKIKALNSLRSIDRRASMAVALNELGRDCGSGSLQYKLLIQGFGDIIPLLFDQVPWVEVWHLLEEYLVEFCAGHKQAIGEVSTVLTEALDGVQDRSRALLDVLFLHLDHPSHHVASAAIRCTARLLLEPDTDIAIMTLGIDRAMQRSERAMINSLVALHTVAMRDRLSAVAFRDLVSSPKIRCVG